MTQPPGPERKKIHCRCVGALAGAAIAITGCTAQQSGGVGRPAGVNYYVEGLQAQHAGQQDQAIADFEKAIAANPNLRMAHALLGDAYRKKGEYARAATEYQALTRLDEYTATNHYNLGLTLQFLNRLQEAATAYLQALRLNPQDVKSNMNLGLVYLALGDMDESVAYLRKAAQLDPNNAQAWSNLGVALDASGKPAEAEETYRKALELDSKNVVTLQNLAQNLIGQKKATEALAIMEQVLKQDNSPAAQTRYANALSVARRYDEAITWYDKVLKNSDDYIPAMNGKASALISEYVDGMELNEKLRTTALDLWRASLKLNANQPQIAESLRKWENPALFGN